MKLQPVYLLAPEPEPKSMTSRRAFLLAGCTFATGTLIGGACGYSLGASRGSGEPEDPKKVGSNDEVELKSSGDADLDELRWLAVKAPIEVLVEKAIPFMSLRAHSYRTDKIVWQGVGRLSSEVLQNPRRAVDPTVIGMLIGQIEGGGVPNGTDYSDRIPRLRKRRDEEKRRK